MAMSKDPHAPHRRQLLRALAAAVAAGPVAALAARAQPGGAASGAGAETRFPLRPITLWVPWPAGGATEQSQECIAAVRRARRGWPRCRWFQRR